MNHFLDTLTHGNVPQVKTVLATVALALAVYQLVLIARRPERQEPGWVRP
jgi:hypothetical protein